MNREPDAEGGSEVGDGPPDEFDAIVSGWQLEGTVPEWPTDGIPPSLFDAAADAAAVDPGAPQTGRLDGPALDSPAVDSPATAERTPPLPFPVVPPTTSTPSAPPPPAAVPPPPRAAAAQQAPADDEHYVPPEPPPLPRLGPPAIVGIALLVLGIVLIVSPGWVGVSSIYGLPLGLLGLAAGLGWLVLRLWPDSPETIEPDEDDDGAVL